VQLFTRASTREDAISIATVNERERDKERERERERERDRERERERERERDTAIIFWASIFYSHISIERLPGVPNGSLVSASQSSRLRCFRPWPPSLPAVIVSHAQMGVVGVVRIDDRPGILLQVGEEHAQGLRFSFPGVAAVLRLFAFGGSAKSVDVELVTRPRFLLAARGICSAVVCIVLVARSGDLVFLACVSWTRVMVEEDERERAAAPR
jgi:hypothetical protein